MLIDRLDPGCKSSVEDGSKTGGISGPVLLRDGFVGDDLRVVQAYFRISPTMCGSSGRIRASMAKRTAPLEPGIENSTIP